jgi:hypothetical protein
MNDWGRRTFGEPCSVCGFSWATPVDAVTAAIDDAPVAFGSLVVGRTGSERMPSLAWSIQAYVWHAGDNLRIWAERLVASASGSGPAVAGYDQDALAESRRYEAMPLGAALWSLDRAAVDWREASRMVGDRADAVIEHQAMGGFTLTDVTRHVGHDLHHHLDDVRRILGYRDGST